MVLCRLVTTFVWLIQKPQCPLVHMEIGNGHYCVNGFGHCHMQFQENQYLLSVFGIHHAMQKDTRLNLQTHSSICLTLTPKYYTKWRTKHHRHNYNYLHPMQFLVVLHFHHTLIISVLSLVYKSHSHSSFEKEQHFITQNVRFILFLWVIVCNSTCVSDSHLILVDFLDLKLSSILPLAIMRGFGVLVI